MSRRPAENERTLTLIYRRREKVAAAVTLTCPRRDKGTGWRKHWTVNEQDYSEPEILRMN